MDNHVAQELAQATFAPQRRAWRLALVALGLATILVAIALLVLSGPTWPIWILATLALVALVGTAYSQGRYESLGIRRAQLQAGLRGQAALVKTLGVLDDSYYLVNNLKLPGRADDIDHLLIGPNGVFALETKNHRGRIYARDGQWYQVKTSHGGRLQPEKPMRDPARQLKRNVDYLRSCLNRTNPALCKSTRLWIEGVVVFTHPKVDLDLPDAYLKGLPFPVLRGRELPRHIRLHVPRRTLSRAEVSRLVSMFAHLHAPEENGN